MIYGRKYSLCHVHYAVFTWCGAMRCIRSRREINLSRYSLAAQARGIVYFTRSSAISMHQIELFLLFHSGNPRMTIVLLINSDSINTDCSFSSFFLTRIYLHYSMLIREQNSTTRVVMILGPYLKRKKERPSGSEYVGSKFTLSNHCNCKILPYFYWRQLHVFASPLF